MNRIGITGRWVFALVLLILAWRILGYAQGSVAMIFVCALASIICLVFAGVAMSPEFIALCSEPFGRLIDRIFLPRATGTPPVSYILADLYRGQNRHGDALEQYLKIIHFHPDEFDAYVGGIEMAIRVQETKIARRLQKKAERRFRSAPDQELIRKAATPE